MKGLLSGIRAVVFDLDGTLLDSTHVWNTVDCNTFKRQGLDYPADYLNQIAGMAILDAARFTISKFSFKNITPEELTEFWESECARLFRNSVQYTAGAIEFIRLMKSHGMKLAIGTASPHNVVDAFFAGRPQDRELFDFIVSCDDVGVGKPNPAVFLECCKRLGVPPSEVVIFEDSKHGLEAARATGAKVVALMSGPNPPANCDSLMDYTANSFAEIIEALGH